MITKDLGAVSAYAYAVEQGYTGTETEFAELMASYASVAQQASQSAQTATEKAQQASASATSASQSASTASASAQTAQTAQQTATAKASEAQQSATTATTKAQEASQSASESAQSAQEASQSASDAQTAKTASETAQGIAETARDEAVSARDTAQQYAESIDPQKLTGAYPVDTATGAIASFSDGADNIPMKKVTVRIEPKQAGTGDPSPDNVRPISGWDSVVVEQSAVNIFDKAQSVDGYINNANGELRQSLKHNKATGYISVVPNATYYIKSDQSKGAWGAWYDIEKNFISEIIGYIASGTDENKTKTAPSNARYMRLTIEREDEDSYTGNVDTFSVNYPATDHDYHPYSGNSLSIPLPQTVYGGTLDVTTGELVVDRAQIASYNGEALPSTWISDRDVYASGTTPTIGAQVVYKLASPITYSLTPQEITSLLGDNNVWADAGDTEVTYRADTTLYINRKIAEAVSALS